LTVPLITSEAMAANALGAVDASALAIANGATGITTGRDAVVHAEDTTPLPIGSVGSPNTIAAPATSLFQSDLVGVRLVSFVSWGLRAASKAAIVNGVTW
jgi:hypothetical protein